MMWKYIRPLNKLYTKGLNYFGIKFTNKYPNKGPIDFKRELKIITHIEKVIMDTFAILIFQVGIMKKMYMVK